MSKSKRPHALISGLLGSDSEDSQIIESNTVPAVDSAAENQPPAKKGRGRPKAAKSTKAKAPTRSASVLPDSKEKKSAPVEKKSRRKALVDKTNQQDASGAEELDDLGGSDGTVTSDKEIEESVVAIRQTDSKTTKKKSRAGKPVKEADSNIETNVPTPPKPRSRPGRKKAVAAQDIADESSPEKIIYETQVPTVDEDGDVDEEVERVVSKTAHNSMRPRSNSRARPPSVQRRPAGSASDTERGEPGLRRKLGEVTKKYDNLHIKYQDLREIGIKEADRNFERLKKETEEERKRSNNLVASLKADIAAQIALAKEAKTLKKKLELKTTEMAALQAQFPELNGSLSELRAENKTLSAEVKALIAEKKSLSTENRTLSAKLAATRSGASATDASTKVPGSGVKANGGVRLMGNSEAAQITQMAQLKEDLYGDLTGLIVRGVKRESEEDIFDCIQTGRNGTLHFKLAIANEKTSDSYDEAQCSYVPQLDPRRDNDLIEQLPDYLVDEIAFPRPQAAKFYARVVKALTT